jgi:hypothetical protein
MLICGVHYLIDSGGPQSSSVDPNLKRPYSDAYILSFETALTKHLAFKVNGIYKESKNFIGTIDLNRTADWFVPVNVLNPITNSPLTVYDYKPGYPPSSQYYTNPDRAYRKYKGLQFILEKSMSDNFMFLFSYTLSKANGLVNLGTWASGGMTAGGGWNNPNVYINTDGLLDLDKTHQFKFSGVYYAPFGIIVGLNYIGQSGSPYARNFRVNLSTGPTGFNGEIPGSKRTPFQHMVDVRIEKNILVGSVRPSIFFEAFNLFNANTAIGIGSQYASPTFDQITAILPPRIFRLGVGLNF